MTDEELRIRVAELCGWMFLQDREMGDIGWQDTTGRLHADIPDYCNDLNAMAEAVGTLSKTQRAGTLNKTHRQDYVAFLWDMLGLEKSSQFWTEENFECAFEFANATARQRALAFVSTLTQPKP